MKIALLSDYSIDDYKNYQREINWTTPRGIYDAFKRDNRTNEIRWYPLPPGNKMFGFQELKRQYDSEEFIPDIIFLMNAGPLNELYWDKAIFPKSILVYEAGDEPQTFRDNTLKAVKSDIVFTPDYECCSYYKSININAHWIAHQADPIIYYPNYFPPEKNVVTTMYGNRGDIVPYLQANLGESFFLKNGLKDIENGDVLRSGKIVFQKARYGEITRRIFEGMACKKLVITDRISTGKKLEELFIDGQDIILYNSKEDALEKIKYYLTNDSEREIIAENGFNKVMANHTTTTLINKIYTLVHP
jgi:hypothetical protein